MRKRQHGFTSLKMVFFVSILVAGVAVVGLMSMRHERNLFAEGAAKAGKMVGSSRVAPVLDAAQTAATGGDTKMRKCVINGKTVISNTDCVDANPTSKDIKIQVTRGVEAPKLPPPPPEENDPHKRMLDKMIEKQSL
ncbi:hypothetical protein [Massilia sp. CF038]|uniref:hypothetical protein n=1 Tax=Massilia sp. CF038 TaxID=1881045 RepID=UPI000919951C|nr:hypothetical protein [Massilia sp. CF038]SHG36428.1 hypothetical protein SAMN05428948_0093 [Massilia sp. CF038]